MESIVKVVNLTKRFDDFSLGSLSFQVPGGSVVGIFGPNGAGKTTLLRLLFRQLLPEEGSIEILGRTFEEKEKPLKNLIGYVPQEPSFYWDKSVSWTGRFVAGFYENWDGARFHQFLEYFRINPLKRVKQLSRGQKTLLSIAIALSHEPRLLILDEPTAGLDMIIRRNLLTHIRKFAGDQECGVIVASHFTDGLDNICDYVCFLSRGQLVLEDSRDELLDRWKWIHFKEDSLDPALVEALVGLKKNPFHHSGLTRDFSAIRDRLGAGIASGDIRVENATLDDILIALLKGEGDVWPA
jgi:ABC-2 type transport system ATP-binding protein